MERQGFVGEAGRGHRGGTAHSARSGSGSWALVLLSRFLPAVSHAGELHPALE